MTILRQFMVWVTASNLNKSPNQNFQSLRWRLLVAYLTAMAVIFGISETILYLFFANSLNQQLNERLLAIAQAAVPSLEEVKNQELKQLDRELPWRNLVFQKEQSLEWYDAEGKFLAREGTIFPEVPLEKKINLTRLNEGSPIYQKQGGVVSVTIAVYVDSLKEKTLELEGYIRASQSTNQLQTTLNHLILGLALGGIIALVLIAISSIYLTQQALQPTKQSLQQLKQFAAEASHELRNPLTKIVIATELMLNHSQKIQPADLKKLEIIDNAASQMKRLVEDLLFLARTDASTSASTNNQLNVFLDQLLNSLVEQFELQAQTKKITLQKELASQIAIKGDFAQLQRLFANLLENAFKYTPVGGKITVSLISKKYHAIVSVEDTGIGITPENLPLVFQRFWRSEKVRYGQTEGLGLGLAIAQAIARQHGAEITVSSSWGEGSCFQVTFPLSDRNNQ